MRARVLFLENTPDVGRAVASILERNQFDVHRVDQPHAATDRLSHDHFDVLLVEIKPSPDDPGLQLLRHVNGAMPHLGSRIVVIANDASPAIQREIDAVGICDLVLKPVHEAEIVRAIEECLDRMSSAVH